MLTVLNMSLTASIVIVFVLAMRLLLKKAPRIFSYALWGVVLFRLLCPVSISSDFSLLGLLDRTSAPVTQHTTTVAHIPPDAVVVPAPMFPNIEFQKPNTDRPSEGQTVESPSITAPTIPNTGVTGDIAAGSIEPAYSITDIVRVIWLTGIGAMLIYSTVSFLRLRRKLMGAVRLRENIYLADYLNTPFVMGLLRARIYLPSSLSEREQRYILLHEQQHIRRLDHIFKALAFLALCIHWFNPLVWIAFMLSGKDMEMSCDEAVMRKMGEDIRTEYSASLLSLATGRRIIAGTPLAFGEGDTKGRIKNVLNWKKPKLWVILIAGIVCIAVVAFCAGNPESNDDDTVNDDMPIQSVDDATDLESFVGYMISNGFLYQSGDSVVAISGGIPVSIPMTAAQATVNHNGREFTADYCWTKYGNALAATSHSSDYSVTPLPRSDRYLQLVLDMGYTYLIDTVTGEVSDPLSVLDSEITQRLSIVNLSPDGQYAVISHHSGTECILLNCTTGEVTQLPYASDIYSVSGHFLDETHIALSTAFEVGDDIRYSLARYDITSGELTELPGQYTAKDRTDFAFLAFCDDEAFAYTFENGCLVIVDLMTWERTLTNFKAGDLTNVFYCEGALAGVVHLGTVYILDHEGNARAVCKVVTENAVAAESESEQEVEMEVSTPLSEEELAYFASLFEGESKTFTQMLLSCRYDAPEDINLGKIFSEGVPNDLGGWGYDVSEAEEAALSETMESADYEAALNYDRHKIPAAVMEKLLREYLGLSIAETNRVGFELLTYLEEYDAYYAFSGTSERVIPVFTSGMRRADGTVELCYHKQHPLGKVGSPTHVLVLRPAGDSYQFVANVQTVPLPSDEPFRAAPTSSFWYDLESTELSEEEIDRIGMTLWAFLSTHGAALTGTNAVLPSYELVAREILAAAKVEGMRMRYHLQSDGYYIHRCLNRYDEILDMEYDAESETLTMTIREHIDIYYSLSRIEPPTLPIAETAVKHELVFTKSEAGEFILTGRSNDWIYEYYNLTSGYVRFG